MFGPHNFESLGYKLIVIRFNENIYFNEETHIYTRLVNNNFCILYTEIIIDISTIFIFVAELYG